MSTPDPAASPLPTAAAPTERAVAVCAVRTDGSVITEDRADRPFYAASTIKLLVLLATLRASDAGALDLDAVVPATRTFTGHDGEPFTLDGDHLDPTHPAEGAPVMVRDLALRMIDRSSNEATNHLMGLLPNGAIVREIEALALTGTRLERQIGDASALAAGLTNETTPRDLTVMLRALVTEAPVGTAAALSPASRELAVQALDAQQIRIISVGVADGFRCGSKSGWVPGFRHDAAWIRPTTGLDAGVVIAVMTQGFASEPEADEAIRAAAKQSVPGTF